MNRDVVIAKPEATLKEASEVMAKFHIGSLVISDGEKIFGILTSSDILKAIASGKDVGKTLIDNVMTKNVITIEPDKDIEAAVDLMVQNKIKKLPVVDQGRLVGVITASDIFTIEPKLLANLASLLSTNMANYTGG
ncbi:MAG: CBS domain-containing protein [Candidatus Aenigmarchaeota archaeon]|nr:CBS domain-containing protein [Candidatus Aenigmarchaeota archaeon]